MSKILIIHGDCMSAMKEMPDKAFDLAITDPIYGISENGNRDLIPKGAACARKKYNPSLWKQEKTKPEYFKELQRVSTNQIIFGGNYFTLSLPESRCWIVWDKRVDCPGNDFADCEIAWTSFSTSIRKFSYLWNGMIQQNMKQKENRIHPTQKPVALYQWLLKNYAKPGDKILDTHGGSCSSAIACDIMGFDATIYEIDADYYKAAVERFERHKQQTVLEFG